MPAGSAGRAGSGQKHLQGDSWTGGALSRGGACTGLLCTLRDILSHASTGAILLHASTGAQTACTFLCVQPKHGPGLQTCMLPAQICAA